MKVLAPFQQPLFRVSVYGTPTCFALLDNAERVQCALKTSIIIPVLEIVFLFHGDIVSFDAAFCVFP